MTKKFEAFSPEAKKRLAAEAAVHQKRMSKIPRIEGRPELFETKIFRIQQEGAATENTKKLLVATRDPGSGNALTPVLKELVRDKTIQIDIITDGRAQEIIQKNFTINDVTPPGMILEADNIIGTLDVILMDRSNETGIDSYVAATFLEVPKILVEDYYSNTPHFLSELKKRGLPLPEKICVMDAGAKELIVKIFPDLEDRIEITGQPAFDKFVHEDTEKLAAEVKEKLGLCSKDKIVSFMSTFDEPEKVKKMAEALKKAGDDFYFIFRRHPRDNVGYEIYRRILTEAGIKIIDTDDFSTNDIGAASNVVLTTWSTEGLNGIYRRKPTVHITDFNFKIPQDVDLPLVPVKLGASVGINDVSTLTEVLPQLLDPASPLNQLLKEKMEQAYPADGNNAKRVADVVRSYLLKHISPHLQK